MNIYLYKCKKYYCDFDNHRIFNKKELLTDKAVLTHRAEGWPDLAGSQSSRSKQKIDGPALCTLREHDSPVCTRWQRTTCPATCVRELPDISLAYQLSHFI